MAQALNYDDLVRMLRGGAAAVREAHDELSRLDSAVGDGDHGSAMRRAMKAAEKAAGEAGPGDAAGLLRDVGWAVMGAAGGAPGPLLGAFFLGMSEGAPAGDAPLDAASLAVMFESGLAGLRKQTPAAPGDKTMLDALVPAVEAMRAAADGGADVGSALERAAEAAGTGAAATADMQARFGKARGLGPRSVGTADPGATSVARLFRGFAAAVPSERP